MDRGKEKHGGKRWLLWLLLGVLVLTGCGQESPAAPEPHSRYLGGDVSSLIEAEENGCVYYDREGRQTDVFQVLTQSGMNSVRIRIWNDPVDEAGKPYLDGHNDLQTAIQIGKRASDAGMQVCIDFHYSDHWADPAQQIVPKAWKERSFAQKEQALYDFTVDSLTQLLQAGVNVTMVQVGNETTNGIAGERQWDAMTALMSAGSRAVRDVSKAFDRKILVALHFTGCEGYDWFASQLQTYQVDYDVFAASYYPYWHGTPAKQVYALRNVAEKYGKKVIFAEFSYPYSLGCSDNYHNAVGNNSQLPFAYPTDRQGQQQALREALGMCEELGEACLGLFYWEPAWIGYAGKNGAGSPWENQALFDKSGHPLPALQTFLEFTKDAP